MPKYLTANFTLSEHSASTGMLNSDILGGPVSPVDAVSLLRDYLQRQKRAHISTQTNANNKAPQ